MRLTQDLIFEIARCCTLGTDFLETVRSELKFSFFKEESFKKLFKAIFDYYDQHFKHPTLGTLSQKFTLDEDMRPLIDRIRKVDVVDRKQDILIAFEEFIRLSRYQQLLLQSKEEFTNGDKDVAIKNLAEESVKISNFSLQKDIHSKIFRDFGLRQQKRKERDFTEIKVPTGIPAFDHHTLGGIEKGSSLLIMAMSGVGKSTALRWMGFSAALRGLNVVHFQAEGTKQEVEDYYDAIWTGIEYHTIKKGEFDGKQVQKIEKARDQFIHSAGEIYVVAFEQFDTASVRDCRANLKEIIKECDIDIVLFDYLEEFEPGDGKKYSTGQDGVKARKKAVAKKITNIATEFKVAVATATQSHDVSRKERNSPDFILTRSNISNDKETIQPFAYFLTLNRTDDEEDSDILRIWEEKLRHHKLPSDQRLYKIAQAPKVGRFIDVTKTNLLFWDSEKKRKRV